MSRIAFLVGCPALMGTMMAQADLERVFSLSVVASYGAIVLAALLGLLASFTAFRSTQRGRGRVITVLLACYSNAGNIGLPVAAYALGDVTWIAPILIIQMAFLQPAALTILEASRGQAAGQGLLRVLSTPFRNPMTVGVLLGLAINLAGWTIPSILLEPLTLVGQTAVPLMLLAFGVSLRADPRPQPGPEQAESWFLALTKVAIQPLFAFGLAHLLGLPAETIHAVTVVACLPPAQNIFMIASRYDVRLLFARDTIFRATGLAVVTILAATALTHP